MTDDRPVLVDLDQLAQDGLTTNKPGLSQIHGEHHWRCVALMGLWLAERTSGADPEFMLVFAQLHDAMRESDGLDPEHGLRAAGLYRRLLADDQAPHFEAMTYALQFHNMGGVSAHQDVNVAIAWDADRLNLWRVGIEPNPAFMSTDAGATTEAIDYGRHLCDSEDLPSWPQIADGVRTTA